ncbi:MAG: ATP-binding protein [Anaerolineae bacterium]|jgi:signal transduction histidine kinase
MTTATETEKRMAVPTTGMRGGLGRRLLTAFLVMTIGPLSVLSWYAARSGRRNIERQVISKLGTVAAATELRLREWADSRARAFDILASGPDVRDNCAALDAGSEESETARVELSLQLEALLRADPAFRGVSFLNRSGQALVTTGTQQPLGDLGTSVIELSQAASVFQITSLDPAAEAGAVVVRPVKSLDGKPIGTLVGRLSLDGLGSLLESVGSVGEVGHLYVVDRSGMALPQGHTVHSEGIEAAQAGDDVEGSYENGGDTPVIGVYRDLPDLGLVMVAEQPRAEALAAADRVTAAIIAAALVVALVTSVIAAVVTRQITEPLVSLTESALHAADGDLEQRVHVESRDEIGILARVFNRMLAELGSLYNGLEAKVAERTKLLREANRTIQRRAVQLATTVEISRAITSILDPGELLRKVVRAVHDQFDYPYVGVYLLAEDGERLVPAAGIGDVEAVEAAKAHPVTVGSEEAVSQAVLSRKPVVHRWSDERTDVPTERPRIRVEVALPLTVRDDILGVLDILTVAPERIDEDTLSILSSVASQVAVAMDNARAYRNEKEALQRLREAEDMRSRFLAHMSRELREPLTNIIGFCRLILNGLDGPISDQQRHDLRIIHANSEHLLGLINDLLDVSQIEAGLMELHFEDVDLAVMTKSVMATASALVRDKEIELRYDVDDLPLVKADSSRVRQVLLKLLTNAAKFTEEGSIALRAWSEDGEVFVSVRDTGIGIPLEDQKRIFEQFEQGVNEHGRRPNGAGLGLGLSKQFVEMHGGEIWVESEPGRGSVFTFSLPLDPEFAPSDVEAAGWPPGP